MPTDNIDQTAGESRRKAGNLASPGQEQRTRYARNTRTISGRLHDEMVMMDLDQGKYFSLNPIATRIWDLLDQELTVDELCALLREEYEVESRQCIDEVSEHLEEMSRLGLVLTSSKA